MKEKKVLPIEISVWDIPSVKHKGEVYRVINTEAVKKGSDYIITDVDSDNYLDVVEDIMWDKLCIGAVSDLNDVKGLRRLTFLKELDLSYGDITKIAELSNLINLEILNLSNNKITAVKSIFGLMKLKELYLDNNNILELDAKLLPQSLEILSVKENSGIKFKNFDRLRNLKEFRK